jgi:hypothetical protein
VKEIHQGEEVEDFATDETDRKSNHAQGHRERQKQIVVNGPI